MRCSNLIVAFCTLVVMPLTRAEALETLANPAIDIAGYLRVSRQALDHRETLVQISSGNPASERG